MRRLIPLMALLMVVGVACGDDSGGAGDADRFCELDRMLDDLDFLAAAPDEVRELVTTARGLSAEAVAAAPSDIRSAVEIVAAEFGILLDLFEEADFDGANLDPAELDERLGGQDADRAGDELTAWTEENCAA